MSKKEFNRFKLHKPAHLWPDGRLRFERPPVDKEAKTFVVTSVNKISGTITIERKK